MEIILNKKPKGCTIIEGFPGFGLVGTIATEYLINHLKTEEIGQIIIEDASPVVAIHTEKLIKPITINYCKKYNLMIIHSISPGANVEWEIAKAIKDIAKQCGSKQIISIEGVLNKQNPKDNVYYYSNKKSFKKTLEKSGLISMKEGVVIGVTAALLTKQNSNFVSLFAETESQLPDSRAAAKIIKALDSYLGLKINPKPLIKQAELFEAKIKNLVQKGQEATSAAKDKRANYFG